MLCYARAPKQPTGTILCYEASIMLFTVYLLIGYGILPIMRPVLVTVAK
ncbi:MAG: hypothetical protein OXI87_07555 [Albidovulum sp.]|nr:hypothetical protein [Albidovulum sp.]